MQFYIEPDDVISVTEFVVIQYTIKEFPSIFTTSKSSEKLNKLNINKKSMI